MDELHKWETAERVDVVEIPAVGDVAVLLLPPPVTFPQPPFDEALSGFAASFKGNSCFTCTLVATYNEQEIRY